MFYLLLTQIVAKKNSKFTIFTIWIKLKVWQNYIWDKTQIITKHKFWQTHIVTTKNLLKTQIVTKVSIRQNSSINPQIVKKKLNKKNLNSKCNQTNFVKERKIVTKLKFYQNSSFNLFFFNCWNWVYQCNFV